MRAALPLLAAAAAAGARARAGLTECSKAATCGECIVAKTIDPVDPLHAACGWCVRTGSCHAAEVIDSECALRCVGKVSYPNCRHQCPATPAPAPLPPPGPPTAPDVGYELLFDDALDEADDAGLRLSAPVPGWLAGSFVQVGPARWSFGGRNLTHALDGYAKVHRWAFADGAVRFSSKFLRSAWMNESVALGDIAFGVFAQPTNPPLTAGVKTFSAAPNDNNNVNVFALDDGVLELLSDQTTMVEVDSDTLGFRGEHLAKQLGNESNPKLQVATMGSAHPFRTAAGDFLGVRETTRVMPAGKEQFSVYRVAKGSNGTVEDVVSISVPKASYTHSFGLAKGGSWMDVDHVVIAAQPLHVNADTLLLKGTLQAAMQKTGKPTRFFITPLTPGAEALEIDHPAFYFGHFVNTYSPAPGRIVADINVEDDTFFDRYDLTVQRTKALRDAWPATGGHGYETVTRFEFDMLEKTVSSTPLFGVPSASNIGNEHDLFKLHPDDIGRPYCGYWAWQAYYKSASFASWAVIRVELCGDKPTVAAAWHRPNVYPGEASFIPAPGAADKTEGVVVFKALDGATGDSLLVVADARSLATIAEAVLPVRVPYTIHGGWFPRA